MCQQMSMWITTDDNVTYRHVFAYEIPEMLQQLSFSHIKLFVNNREYGKCNI